MHQEEARKEMEFPRYFDSSHLSQPMRGICQDFKKLLEGLYKKNGEVIDKAEFFAGQRKLLEAKDCFVRAFLPKEQV